MGNLKVMVGVSTAQNISNFIPAIQKQVEKVVLLETTTAQKEQWSNGIQNVLDSKNIKFETLDISNIDSNIVEIQKKLQEKFESTEQPILWNLGGGQKPQQIAIWESFKARSQKNKTDILCYTNQDSSKLELWFYENGNLKNELEDIQVILTAKEIFGVFGFEVIQDYNQRVIYSKSSSTSQRTSESSVKDFYQFPEFREFLFRLAAKQSGNPHFPLSQKSLHNQFQTLFQNFQENDWENFKTNDNFRKNSIGQVLNQSKLIQKILSFFQEPSQQETIPITNSSLKEDLKVNKIDVSKDFLKKHTKEEKPANYFEKIVIQRVQNLLNTKNHNIVYAYANLQTRKANQVSAEYDVLCITNRGTILTLDAKTYDFTSKDIDARLYNLEKGAGFYRKFVVVIPFDFEDIDKPWFPKALQNLPFKLKEKKMDFYVISDSQKQNFWIRKNGQNLEKQIEKPNDITDWIECKLLESFLKREGLLIAHHNTNNQQNKESFLINT